jgi:hypothetical protein
MIQKASVTWGTLPQAFILGLLSRQELPPDGR